MIVDKLFETNPFSASKEDSDLFIAGVRETASIHYRKNPFFRFLWEKFNLIPDAIQSEEDLKRLPYIMVNLFKQHELISGPKSEVVLELGSSGTSGQRSMIYLNQQSLDRVKILAYKIHEALGITSKQNYNYICFTYDPAIAKDLGTAFTDELLTNFTGKNEVFYTFKHDGNDFFFDEKGTVKALKRFEKSNLSTRILGFPAFLYEIINKYNIHVNLGEDSWVQTGGGWKSKADEEIPKDEFRSFVAKRLGIPKKNIRDLFGMVEHGIPYVDCAKGRLRVPNYSRVFIRDPRDMTVLPYGEVGLIQFICHYNSSFPAMSLLTTDYGVLRKDNFGEYIEILGRAGVSKNKGCAIKALELMQ